MLPVWEATLDEIESKLLDLSALQMRSLCEMLKLNVGEGETHTSCNGCYPQCGLNTSVTNFEWTTHTILWLSVLSFILRSNINCV